MFCQYCCNTGVFSKHQRDKGLTDAEDDNRATATYSHRDHHTIIKEHDANSWSIIVSWLWWWGTITALGPILQRVYKLIIEISWQLSSLWLWFLWHYQFTNLNMLGQLCCAKLWSGWIIIFQVRATSILTQDLDYELINSLYNASQDYQERCKS